MEEAAYRAVGPAHVGKRSFGRDARREAENKGGPDCHSRSWCMSRAFMGNIAAGLIIAPSLHAGFRFEVHDVKEHKRNSV
jgi:hypothetical protein